MRTVFSQDALVLALEGGPKLGLDSTLPLMQHARNAVLARLGSSSSELLSGHDVMGAMSRQPHLALVPMGFIGSQYADASLKGIAFVLPTTTPAIERRRLRAALAAPWQLHLGPLGSISMRYVDSAAGGELKSLNFGTYVRPSDTWASVTPVVLDRYPKKKGPSVEAVVAMACQRIGLPLPVEVRVGPVSAIAGAPLVRDFHGHSKQVDRRMRQHVVIKFDQSVRGPVLLGAGRFLGLGLCIPLRTSMR